MFSAGNRLKRLVPSTCTGGICDSEFTPPTRCAEAAEFKTISLGCPAGKTIDKLLFASFGTPEGSCAAGLKLNPACDANKTMPYITSQCVGKNNCSIEASSATFGAENAFFASFYTKNERFTMTGSGQT
jgi:hypothetical protein